MTHAASTTTDAPMDGMVALEVWGWRCHRCEHEWLPREDRRPRVCPRCKSPYWDTPRKVANA